MTEKAKVGAVYDDVVAAPELQIAEIVEGDLYLSPRPALRHSRVLTTLSADIHDAFDRGRRGPGGWIILDEPEVHLVGDVLVPDIAGWRRERLLLPIDGPAMTIAPDWLCEILSPSTERFDRMQKLPRYALAGVGHVWMVDFTNRRLEVYERRGLAWERIEEYSSDAIVHARPFDAVGIELAPLWD